MCLDGQFELCMNSRLPFIRQSFPKTLGQEPSVEETMCDDENDQDEYFNNFTYEFSKPTSSLPNVDVEDENDDTDDETDDEEQSDQFHFETEKPQESPIKFSTPHGKTNFSVSVSVTPDEIAILQMIAETDSRETFYQQGSDYEVIHMDNILDCIRLQTDQDGRSDFSLFLPSEIMQLAAAANIEEALAVIAADDGLGRDFRSKFNLKANEIGVPIYSTSRMVENNTLSYNYFKHGTSGHWVVCILNIEKNEISFYDSLKRSLASSERIDEEFCRKLMRAIRSQLTRYSIDIYEEPDWKSKDLQQQTLNDCGCFAAVVIDMYANGLQPLIESLNFSDDDIKIIRLCHYDMFKNKAPL